MKILRSLLLVTAAATLSGCAPRGIGSEMRTLYLYAYTDTCSGQEQNLSSPLVGSNATMRSTGKGCTFRGYGEARLNVHADLVLYMENPRGGATPNFGHFNNCKVVDLDNFTCDGITLTDGVLVSEATDERLTNSVLAYTYSRANGGISAETAAVLTAYDPWIRLAGTIVAGLLVLAVVLKLWRASQRAD